MAPGEKDYTSTLARMAGNIAGVVTVELLKSEERDIKSLRPDDIGFIAFLSALIANETLARVLYPTEGPPQEIDTAPTEGD